MTCVVSIETEKGVYLGCESLGSNTFTSDNYHYSKIFQVGEMFFGISGSYRVAQALQYSLVVPERGESEDDEAFLAGKLVNHMRLTLEECGCLSQTSAEGTPSVQNMGEASLILAYRDKIYLIQSDFSILRPKSGEICIGSGGYHAQASLFTSKNLDIPPEDRIKLALQCASNYVISCNDDIRVIFIPNEEYEDELEESESVEEEKDTTELESIQLNLFEE